MSIALAALLLPALLGKNNNNKAATATTRQPTLPSLKTMILIFPMYPNSI
jgi:hypothetical protein